MAEYINRYAFAGKLLQKQFEKQSDKITISEVIRLVNSQPKADVVEVIRCKNCEYWDKRTVNDKGFVICPVSGMEIHTEDYCSYGERKINND
jgi:hypothetical protein